MKCGYKVDKSLHHYAGILIVANNRSPAGNMKGSNLCLDDKEKLIVAKQPVRKCFN